MMRSTYCYHLVSAGSKQTGHMYVVLGGLRPSLCHGKPGQGPSSMINSSTCFEFHEIALSFRNCLQDVSPDSIYRRTAAEPRPQRSKNVLSLARPLQNTWSSNKAHQTIKTLTFPSRFNATFYVCQDILVVAWSISCREHGGCVYRRQVLDHNAADVGAIQVQASFGHI